MALERASLAMRRFGSAENKLDKMAYNTSGSTRVASRNVTPTNNPLHKWVYLAPEMIGFRRLNRYIRIRATYSLSRVQEYYFINQACVISI
jgi:hypothetical protein